MSDANPEILMGNRTAVILIELPAGRTCITPCATLVQMAASDMSVLFSAGEASGDAYSARLAKELLARRPQLRIRGVGGRRLSEVAEPLVADSSRWGAIGIYESVLVAPRVLAGYRLLKRELASRPPGLFVPIDYGFMNVRLCRHARRHGWRVLYFLPPGSWRRDRQGAELPSIADHIVTQFPWSAQLLQAAGAAVSWFGHPLKQMVAEERLAASVEPHALALLPGSRMHEVEANLPVLAKAAEGFELPVAMGVAPSLRLSELQTAWAEAAGPKIASRTSYEPSAVRALLRSKLGLVCSGTATLEAALCACPCVVVYRGSKLMELEYRLRRPRFTYISLPNILLDRPVLPELIQWDATVGRILDEALPLLSEGPARQQQLEAFAQLDAELGPTDAFARTADLALQMLDS